MIDELCKKNIPLNFASYFKYCFSFKGTYQNYEINASIGGSAEDIYRLEVNPNTTMVLSKENFNCISVKNLTTGETDQWSDF